MSAGALGLRAGAGGGAPASGAGTGLAWQIIAFREDRGVRQPDARAMLDVTARNRGREVRWSGATNDDGAAEVPDGLASAEGVSIEVRAEGKLLAGGDG